MITLREAVLRRKSIRAFKPEPVPREILVDLLQTATRSPSAGNIQPWEIHVVTGEPLEGIKQGNVEKLTSLTPPAPDVVINPPTGVYKERRRELFAQLYGLLGVARDDKEGRFESLKDGFRFYDAPAVIILAADRELDEARTQFDLGLLAHPDDLPDGPGPWARHLHSDRPGHVPGGDTPVPGHPRVEADHRFHRRGVPGLGGTGQPAGKRAGAPRARGALVRVRLVTCLGNRAKSVRCEQPDCSRAFTA